MGTPVKFDFDANSAPMERAWQTGTKLIENMIREMAGIIPTAQKADAATKGLNLSTEQLGKLGDKIRRSLVTPQSEYADACREATQALNAETISEGEYAAAVDLAKRNLDAKDVSLQKTLNDAARIRQAAVTPEQAHATAINSAKQALDKKLITQREYDNELRRQNELLDKAKSGQLELGGAASSTLGTFATEITGIGSMLSIVGGTLALVRTEIQEFRDSQKTAAEKQLEVAPAQRAAILNLGDDAAMSPEQLIAEAERISIDNQVGLAKVYDALSNALSSKGALTSAQAVAATDLALKTTPHSGATEIAGSILDMENRFGGTEKQMMGINLGTQQASRVKDAGSFAKNVVPTIVQLGGFKDSVEESSRLVAALSTAMNDLEGRQSSTAAEQLAKQLAIALPNLKNTTERFQFLQTAAGEKDRIKLFGDGKGKKGSATFESGAYVAMHELVAPGSNKTKDAYTAATAAIPTLDKAEAYYDGAMQRVNRQSLQQQSAFDRQLKTANEQGSVNNLSGARAAMAREGMDQGLKQSGVGWWSRFIKARRMDIAEFTGEQSPEDFATNALGNRASELRAGRNYEGNIIGPTADEVKIADKLDAVARNLESLNTTIQVNTNATKQNTEAPVKVKQVKPASAPTKPRPSEALQNSQT